MPCLLRRDSRISPYMAYPRFLLTMDISETAKLIYVLLLDRARLSMKNDGWEDETGYVFIYYTIKSLAAVSGKSEMTVKNALAVLEQKEIICRQRQGAGLPSKIYVKVQTENCPAEWTSFEPQTDKKRSASNKQRKMSEKPMRNYDYEEGDSL
ncbi:MAG: replication initiator protein A [Oscillospiraceae bacterium]|nr:replication initiator protein A [Oscillospiraceae bacterium]